MTQVHSKDTQPEMRVRRTGGQFGGLLSAALQYLPGNPDLVFPKRRKIIFVDRLLLARA